MTKELEENIYERFVGQINDLRDEDVMKRLLIKTVEQKLIEAECFEIRLTNGIPFKRLTEKGQDLGLRQRRD